MNSFDTIKLKEIIIDGIVPSDILFESEYKPTINVNGDIEYEHHTYKVDTIFGINSIKLRNGLLEIEISSKILDNDYMLLINQITINRVLSELRKYIPSLELHHLEQSIVSEIHVTKDVELTKEQLMKLQLLDFRNHTIDTPRTGIIVRNSIKRNKRYFTVYNKLQELTKHSKLFVDGKVLPGLNVYRIETKLQSVDAIRNRLIGYQYHNDDRKTTLLKPTLALCLQSTKDCLYYELLELMEHEVDEMQIIPNAEANELLVYALLHHFKGEKEKVRKYLRMHFSVDTWKKDYSPYIKKVRPFLQKDSTDILKELQEKVSF